MTTFVIEHSIKTAICLAVSYVFYLTFLKKFNLFLYNRTFIVAVALLSVIIPFIRIESSISGIQIFGLNENLLSFPDVKHRTEQFNNILSNKIQPFQILTLLFYVYIIGIGLASIIFISKILKIRYLSKKDAILLKKNQFTLVHTDKINLPFSFFNKIFINPNNFSASDYSTLLNHEQLHVIRKHSYDIILIELVKIFQWFNPIVYLFQNILKQQHEYDVDALMVKNGVDFEEYNNLLCRMAFPSKTITLTSSFKASGTKMRLIKLAEINSESKIDAISEIKTPGKSILKYFYIIPIIILLVSVFSFPTSNRKIQDTISDNAQNQASVMSITELSNKEFIYNIYNEGKCAGNQNIIFLEEINANSVDLKFAQEFFKGSK